MDKSELLWHRELRQKATDELSSLLLNSRSFIIDRKRRSIICVQNEGLSKMRLASKWQMFDRMSMLSKLISCISLGIMSADWTWFE